MSSLSVRIGLIRGMSAPVGQMHSIPDTAGLSSRFAMTVVAHHATILSMVSIQVSEFRATCLSVIERVRQTGQPVLITKHGEPVAELVPARPQAKGKRQGFLGSMRGTASLAGDIVSPVLSEDEWTKGLLEDDKKAGRR
jgi:prevent-host-death family protein